MTSIARRAAVALATTALATMLTAGCSSDLEPSRSEYRAGDDSGYEDEFDEGPATEEPADEETVTADEDDGSTLAYLHRVGVTDELIAEAGRVADAADYGPEGGMDEAARQFHAVALVMVCNNDASGDMTFEQHAEQDQESGASQAATDAVYGYAEKEFCPHVKPEKE